MLTFRLPNNDVKPLPLVWWFHTFCHVGIAKVDEARDDIAAV